MVKCTAIFPCLAKWAGFKKIGEKVVEHRPRKYGVSKIWMEQIYQWFLDLASIIFVGKFGKKAHAFFWIMGNNFFLDWFGHFHLSYYFKDSLIFNSALTNRPGFYLALDYH